MKKYNTILLDIDDTLFDFKKDQEKAFKEAMKDIGYDCTDEMYDDYCNINRNMWHLLENGKLTLQEVYIKRFEIFFEKYNIKESPESFNNLLTLKFQKTGTPMEGAKELLEALKDKYELVIASNGPKDQQYHRLENAGFLEYFSKIFISEEIGYNKPDIKYFNFIFNSINNKDKSKILIIGDSIISDIKGGIDAGIDTCWYNFKNKQTENNIKPTYEVNNITEILMLI